MIERNKRYGCLTVLDLGEEYLRLEEYHHSKEQYETHYKCQCKCGRIHFYSEKTLESNPKYCYYPVAISTRHTYSTRASNATSRKRDKYSAIECVELCDKTDCVPSEEYCNLYNSYKTKQLEKKERERQSNIAAMKRKKASNYDTDYSGMIYESLEVLECVNDSYEVIPETYSPSKRNIQYGSITVYKLYRCRCYLCGKEQKITCDKFGIYAPTQYGIRAYDGYWSDVKCDCHKISSFQWIVNKLLIEHKVSYRVEVSFPDLYGVSGTNLLRFDFGIYGKDGSLECLIECQGEQHYKAQDDYGGESQFRRQQKNDEIKRKYVESKGIKLVEIKYTHKKYEQVEAILIEKGILQRH